VEPAPDGDVHAARERARARLAAIRAALTPLVLD